MGLGSKDKDRNKMKMIVSQVGTPYLGKDLITTFRYDADMTRISEFKKRLFNKTESLEKLIEEFADIFDSDLYVLQMGVLLKDDIDAINRAKLLRQPTELFADVGDRDVSPETRRKKFVKAKELLKNTDVAIISVDKNGKVDYIYTTEQLLEKKELIEKRIKESEERLAEIDENIGLGNVLEHLSPSDLIYVCRYPNLGNALAVGLYKDKKQKKYQSFIDSKEETIPLENYPKFNIFDKREFEDCVRKNIQYIDIDKMLLLANAVYLYKHGNDFSKFDSEELADLNKFTEQVESLLKNKNTKCNSPRFEDVINFKNILSFLKNQLNANFIQGAYCDEDEKSRIIEGIMYGKYPLDKYTKSEFKALNFTIGELVVLTNIVPSSLQYLIENEWIDTKQFEIIVASRKNLSNEQVLYLYESKKIDKKQMMEWYNQGKVSIENIKFLKLSSKKDEFSDLVSPEQLIKLYLSPNSKDSEEFEKYRKLYKTLIIDENSEELNKIKICQKAGDEEGLKEIQKQIIERKKEEGLKLLDLNADLLDESKLYELYHMGILQIDTIVELIGVDAISNLYASGELKPKDARRFYEDGILTEDMLSAVFERTVLSETQKIVLIHSTFPSSDENDVKARKKILQYMKELTGGERNSSSRKDKISKPKTLIHNVKNKNVTDPCARWNLISSLDEEYSQEYLLDGHIVFYLPNSGKYIIEKLYEKNQRFAYGAATYIIDESVFKSRKNEIVQKGKIDRTTLTRLHAEKEEGVKKLVHSGWGNAIVKFFDIENSPEYSKEEKKRINDLAQMVEKSKKPITRDDD